MEARLDVLTAPVTAAPTIPPPPLLDSEADAASAPRQPASFAAAQHDNPWRHWQAVAARHREHPTAKDQRNLRKADIRQRLQLFITPVSSLIRSQTRSPVGGTAAAAPRPRAWPQAGFLSQNPCMTPIGHLEFSSVWR